MLNARYPWQHSLFVHILFSDLLGGQQQLVSRCDVVPWYSTGGLAPGKKGS
jgi:hypothetical protein